jgi:hypothetical protein
LIAIGSTCSTDSSGIKICTPFGIYSLPYHSSEVKQQNPQLQQAVYPIFLNKANTNDNNMENIQSVQQGESLTNSPGSPILQQVTYLEEENKYGELEVEGIQHTLKKLLAINS